MISRGSGQIVVMSSLSGKLGTPVASSYSATKFALHGYFDALRTEVQHLGVSVSLLCPGPVVSEILEHTTGKMNQKESREVRMPTERCTDLISRAMKHKVDELWISDQPLLAVTYMMVYTPWLGRQIMTKFAGISSSPTPIPIPTPGITPTPTLNPYTFYRHSFHYPYLNVIVMSSCPMCRTFSFENVVREYRRYVLS